MNSAYAAEENNFSKQFTVAQNGSIKFNDNVNLGDNKERIAEFVGLSGDFFLDTIVQGNTSFEDFHNAFRSLALGGIAMIPYGGIFASTVLNLLWPTLGKSQMELLLEQVSEMIDQRIEVFDGSTLKSEYNHLKNQLQKFENAVNGVPYAPAPVVNGVSNTVDTPQLANRNAAKDVNDTFERLIELCKKENQEEAELPLYTAVAIAHLEFLSFMDQNALNHPQIQMNITNLKNYYTGNLKGLAEKYEKHITEIAKKYQQKIIARAESVTVGYGHPYQSSYGLDLQKAVDHALVFEKDGFRRAGLGVPDDSWLNANPSDGKKQLMKLRDQLNAYNKATLDNEVLKVVVKSVIGKQGWEKDAQGKWYYFVQGVKATGWKIINNNRYYLNPADGSMATGWKEDSGKWYYLDPANGAMATDWKEVDGKRYYLDPANGVMVTGWKEINGKWYYLDSEDGGAALILTSKVISGKNYNFDISGACVNPQGTEINESIIELSLGNFNHELGNYTFDITRGMEITPATRHTGDGYRAKIYTVVTPLKPNRQYTLYVTAQALYTGDSITQQPIKLEFANGQYKDFDIRGGAEQLLALPFTTGSDVTGDNGTVSISLYGGEPILIKKAQVKLN